MDENRKESHQSSNRTMLRLDPLDFNETSLSFEKRK